jgi:UDP:flavonoid glycosyltransferase YjiC (YdhE family)
MAALRAVARALTDSEDVVALVGLGHRILDAETEALASRRVRVESYVDQWDVPRQASAFITHQGLNSTHEAVYHLVPMISYPFFSDQPGLAKRCRELGLAVPLGRTLRARVDADDVRTALAALAASREEMQERLAVARGWELDVIRQRPEVIERIVAVGRRA